VLWVLWLIIEQGDLMKVALIGSGRVGLPFGLHLYDQGHIVTFCDTNIQLLKKIELGIMPFDEPDFDEVLVPRILEWLKDEQVYTAAILRHVRGLYDPVSRVDAEVRKVSLSVAPSKTPDHKPLILVIASSRSLSFSALRTRGPGIPSVPLSKTACNSSLKAMLFP